MLQAHRNRLQKTVFRKSNGKSLSRADFDFGSYMVHLGQKSKSAQKATSCSILERLFLESISVSLENVTAETLFEKKIENFLYDKDWKRLPHEAR